MVRAKSKAVIAVTEAAYDLRGDDADWLRRVIQESMPLVDHGMGVAGFVGSRPKSQGLPRIEQAHVEATDADFPIRVMKAMSELPAEKIYNQSESGVRLLSELTEEDPRMMEAWSRHVDYAKDAIGITALDTDGRGIHLMAAMPEASTVSDAERERWLMLGAHLCSGLRLRSAPQSSDGPLPQGAEAVIDPKRFRLEDAIGGAQEKSSAELLRDAAIRVDRARGSLRRKDPDEALEIWHALVRGQWSMVDWFDSDQRRFVLAVPNPPRVSNPRGLTKRESQVAAYAAMGERHKIIAYPLGISRPAVSNTLRSAMRKLGVQSQVELVNKFRGWPPPTDDDDD